MSYMGYRGNPTVSSGGGGSGSGGGGPTCYTCGLQGHIAKYCNTICSTCKKVGHTAFNCPFPVCTICNGSHWSQNCTKGGPYRGAAIWKGPASCARCGKRGHFAADCPDTKDIMNKCKKK